MNERKLKFYGEPPLRVDEGSFPGRLIVFEGPDGSGRSTHIRLTKEWLEDHGYGVVDTGLTRSKLAGRGIERAKTGHKLDPLTLNLFYATDFADRLERTIIPALRAGLIVLADRYMYSLIARASVRGVSPEWMQDVYGFAAVPDRVMYLDVDVEHLLSRILATAGGFDYWESGQDFLRGQDQHTTYIDYQNEMIAEFRRLAEVHDFVMIDAQGPIAATFSAILEVIRDEVRQMADEDSDTPPAI